MAKRLTNTPLSRFDEMQQARYSLAKGKDGDGDPAFARDVFALQRKGRNAMTTLVTKKDGNLGYKNNNGD